MKTVYTLFKNITNSTVKDCISRARAKASEISTLNGFVKRLLRQNVDRGKTENEIDVAIQSMDYAWSGKTFTRDELNE